VELINLKSFQRPTELAAAADLLRSRGEAAMILGGGTFIHGLIARGLVTGIEDLVDITGLGLDFVRGAPSGLEIGATTTFSALMRSGEVRDRPLFGALADALGYPPPQVRNAATVGGCLAASCPLFDLPVAMLALDASVTAHGWRGERAIPIEQLYVSLFQTALGRDELLTRARIPVPEARAASAYEKLDTNANDLALVSAGVRLLVRGDLCTGARIFVGGGVGETPVRATEAERALQDRRVEAASIADSAEAAFHAVDPVSDHRASAAYRKATTRVLVRRCLERAARRIAGDPRA
jgi:CO/xanthine dehydrogenase FAD-binding subunit